MEREIDKWNVTDIDPNLLVVASGELIWGAELLSLASELGGVGSGDPLMEDLAAIRETEFIPGFGSRFVRRPKRLDHDDELATCVLAHKSPEGSKRLLTSSSAGCTSAH